MSGSDNGYSGNKPIIQGKLFTCPITLQNAKEYIAKRHRHHRPSLGSVFNLACCDESGKIAGVAMVGRPVSRHIDDGFTLEVTRVATDGTPNACSFLYGAARRIAFELGYRQLITYTLPQEGGASLRGSGWQPVHNTKAEVWDRPGRSRESGIAVSKIRWEVVRNGHVLPETFMEIGVGAPPFDGQVGFSWDDEGSLHFDLGGGR